MTLGAEFDQRLDSLAKFGELLLLAGATAANDSPTHRAIVMRDIERLGKAWIRSLPAAKASVADALIATVHALADATCPTARAAIAVSIRQLVTAARTEQQRTSAPRRVIAEPHRYWVETER